MGKFKEYLSEASVYYTSENDGHKHIYQIRLDDYGETINTLSKDNAYPDHVHKIIKNKIEKCKDHTHTLEEIK